MVCTAAPAAVSAAKRVDAERAQAIAAAVPKVARELRRHRGAEPRTTSKPGARLEVAYFARGDEVAQVLIDARSGKVLEAWTGFQVAWTMARGYPGAFGNKLNAPYVWLPLCLLFALPFLDPRRLRRLLHLDLAVLLAFSVAYWLFNQARIGASVALVCPLLLYLLVRLLLAARRPPREAPRLLVPVSWLGAATVFLIAFRIVLNIFDSSVIDVGYASVVGADRVADGRELYGAFPSDVDHGDTYGPFVYYAYLPFEQLLRWSGRWDTLPAAHAAAIAFDLLTIAALWLLGRRLRGRDFGVVLAYAWAACPFTLLALNTNTNDGLVALLVTLALLLAGSPFARGALGVLAAGAKLGPVAALPVLLTHGGGGRRALALASLGALGATLALGGPLLLGGDLGSFYERTIAFQADRDSPFSPWGYHDGLGWLHTAVAAGAVLVALGVALRPRGDDVVRLAALLGAALVAVQLSATHWFYLYIVWFLPALLVVLLTPPARVAGTARWSPHAAAAQP